MDDIERQAAIDKIVADPEAVHREVIADLRKEKGDAWVDEHMAELEAQWQAAKDLLGL